MIGKQKKTMRIRFGRKTDQLRIVRENRHRQARRQFADQESERGDAGSADDRQFQHPIHPVELPGTVIIPSNGLHTLIDAHDDHHEEESQPIDDTVSTDIEIAAVLLESLVDQNHDETSRKVHQEAATCR